MLILSALSGGGWGLIGTYLLTDGRMDARGWGGLAAAPLIGIMAGAVAAHFRDRSLMRRVFLPLVSLYVTAVLFAVAAAVYSVAFGVVPFYDGGAFGLVGQYVFAVLVGLTLYAWILWPLAIANHLLIWRWTKPAVPPFSLRLF